eukprot:14778318-Ditylum_brightwellii.AAC.1
MMNMILGRQMQSQSMAAAAVVAYGTWAPPGAAPLSNNNNIATGNAPNAALHMMGTAPVRDMTPG